MTADEYGIKSVYYQFVNFCFFIIFMAGNYQTSKVDVEMKNQAKNKYHLIFRESLFQKLLDSQKEYLINLKSQFA